MSDIKFTYNARKNPEGAYIPGVPLADIDAETWKALQKHEQASVKAAPFYTATEPEKASKASTDKEP